MRWRLPIYQYECDCGWEEEVIRSIADRDKSIYCDLCHLLMRRVISLSNFHGEVFQTKAILNDGRKIPGHFGKSAPLQRKK